MNIWNELPLPCRVAGIYLAFGLCWIFASDAVVDLMATSEAQHRTLQTYKGSAFVLLSAGLIGLVVWREARRRSRVRTLFRRVVDLAPDPLLVRNADSNEIREVNQRFADEIGRSRHELLGRSLDELDLDLRELHDEDLEEQLRSEGNLHNYRQSLQVADGKSINLMVSSCRVQVDDSDYVCTVANDVTELEEAYDQTIRGWARALELRDDETFAHTLRVTQATVSLARKLDVLSTEIVHHRRGALLHDIGKIGIPDRILLKDGDLTDEEWEVVRRHPVYAKQLLEPIEYLHPAIDIPYRHHEKWDGTGYPDGLSGEEIPLAARIFAVVDVWDALRSDRPYRDPWSAERVLDHLESEKGDHFQPRIVDAFLDISPTERQNLRNVDTAEFNSL